MLFSRVGVSTIRVGGIVLTYGGFLCVVAARRHVQAVDFCPVVNNS
jgi:hypothetical protein